VDRALLRTAAILAGITVAVFSTTLTADFVYDARLQVLTDPFLHDPRNWVDVLTFRVLGRDVLDFNRPVHLASLMLDAAVWGVNPFGYHLTSILLHAANVVLVWLVVRALLGGKAAGEQPPHPLVPIVAALCFAVHPVVAEAVCEPTFREDLLAAAFTLGAVVLAARHVPARGRDVRRGLACAACCLLAVASKESGVAAPFVLAAWWDNGFWRLAIGGGLAAVVVFLAARFLLEPQPSRIFESRPEYPGGSLTEALKIEPRILALYAHLVACPVNCCADYGGASLRHLPLPPALVIVGTLAVALVWAGRRDRRIAFGTALLALPLVPVSNLVPIYRAAADRYLYLPLAGVAVIAACVVAAAWARGPRERRQAGLAAGLGLLALLAAGTVARQRVWSNSLDLWADTLARNPVSFNAAIGLAGALREAGRFSESEQAARRAVELCRGERGDAWATLALALDGQGRVADADAALATALARQPALADPDARVAALALERAEAEGLKAILARRPPQAAGETPAEP